MHDPATGSGRPALDDARVHRVEPAPASLGTPLVGVAAGEGLALEVGTPATAQNPTHTAAAARTSPLSLSVSPARPSDSRTRPGYTVVSVAWLSPRMSSRWRPALNSRCTV